jgi:hypothetical protein
MSELNDRKVNVPKTETEKTETQEAQAVKAPGRRCAATLSQPGRNG